MRFEVSTNNRVIDLLESHASRLTLVMQPNEQQPYVVPAPGPQANVPPPTYAGNNHDLNAVLGLGAGVAMIAFTCTGVGWCGLPIFALVMGIIGLRGANRAINPGQTRTFAWIAIATGAIFTLLVIGVILLYVVYGIALFAIISGQVQP